IRPKSLARHEPDEDFYMNAIDLLIQDHERVKEILTRLADSTERAVKTRTELLSKLEMEVMIHTELEEQILYPASKEAGGKEEAKEEHRAVDALVLPDLKATEPGSLEFSGRVKVCKELPEHHIEEEEEEMFPNARELFDEARLEEMGAQMTELRNRLKKEFT